MKVFYGGKENDIRIQYLNIISIEYDNCTVSSEVSVDEFAHTDEYYYNKYPKALKVYKIWGLSPDQYITKRLLQRP